MNVAFHWCCDWSIYQQCGRQTKIARGEGAESIDAVRKHQISVDVLCLPPASQIFFSHDHVIGAVLHYKLDGDHTSLSYTQWAMISNLDNCLRASSLPPSCLPYRKQITEFSTSPDEAIDSGAPSSSSFSWVNHQCDHVHSNQGLNNSLSCDTSGASNATSEPGRAVFKLSPSDSSAVTDEDSGYGPTSCMCGRRAASISSIVNSGPLLPDSGAGSSVVGRDELLNVMTEDLVDWLIRMYPQLTENLDVENFFERLSDGVLLCYHANELHHELSTHCIELAKSGRRLLNGLRVGGIPATLPTLGPAYQTRGLRTSNASSSFVSRDNVSNFLTWCRQLGMPDSVLFESEDLVCRKNPRNVAVSLLELARLGGGVGMAVPELIQLEVEIDEEIAQGIECTSQPEHFASTQKGRQRLPSTSSSNVSPHSNDSLGDRGETAKHKNGYLYRTNRSTELRQIKNRKHLKSLHSGSGIPKEVENPVKKKPEIVRPVVDMRSLDEISTSDDHFNDTSIAEKKKISQVRELLSQCTCKQTFPMIRVSEGRYLFGDKCTQIFVRILRNHVMVRVGGGWDTLNHFLTKYDECRKVNPPNCRLPTESHRVSPEKETNLDVSRTEDLLAALDTSSTSSPTIQGSPIRGQGKLNAIKKSPTPPDSLTITETEQRSPSRSTIVEDSSKSRLLRNPLGEYLGQLSPPISCSSPKGKKTEILPDSADTTQSDCFPRRSGKFNQFSKLSGPGYRSTSAIPQAKPVRYLQEDNQSTSPISRSLEKLNQPDNTLGYGIKTKNVIRKPSLPNNKPRAKNEETIVPRLQSPKISRVPTPDVANRLNSKLSKSVSSLIPEKTGVSRLRTELRRPSAFNGYRRGTVHSIERKVHIDKAVPSTTNYGPASNSKTSADSSRPSLFKSIYTADPRARCIRKNVPAGSKILPPSRMPTSSGTVSSDIPHVEPLDQSRGVQPTTSFIPRPTGRRSSTSVIPPPKDIYFTVANFPNV